MTFIASNTRETQSEQINSLYEKVLLELRNYSLFSSTRKWKRSLIITPKLSSCSQSQFTMQYYQFSWNIFPLPHLLFICRPMRKRQQAGNQSFHFPDVTWFSVLFLKGNAIIHHKTNRWIQQVSVQFKNKTRHQVKISVSEFDIFFYYLLH